MLKHPCLSIGPLAVLAACGSPSPPDPTPDTPEPPPVATPVTDVAPAPAFVAADLIRAEWAQAENRDRCAPLGFTDDGGAGGTARPANFSGGWAIAFDLPGQRSAYGLAGPGLISADDGPPYEQSRRLTGQWPYFRELDALTAPSFAGYGLAGAQPYSAENPEGKGEQSIAYVRIHRQACTYNIWSRISRAHLEVLLDGLRLLPTGDQPAGDGVQQGAIR